MVATSSTDALVVAYPKVFHGGLGCLSGVQVLKRGENIGPLIDSVRRMPLALMKDPQSELSRA